MIYLPFKKKIKLVKLINALHDSVALKCKELREKFNKRYTRFNDIRMKLYETVTNTKEFKLFKDTVRPIQETYNNNKIHKEYNNASNKVSYVALIDKKLVKNYNKIYKKYLKETKSALKAYHKTVVYVKYLKVLKIKIRALLKTKEAKNINHCAFKHCNKEYTVIIKLLLKYIKDDKRNLKVYNYLKKINTKTMTYRQYKSVTLILNSLVASNNFNYLTLK